MNNRFLLVAAFLLACVHTATCGILSKVNIFKKKSKEERILLPKLPPHDDTCWMLEFVTDGSDQCEQMEPVVQRLEKDMGIKFRKININRRQEFATLFDCVGGNECGSVPFFYNRRTAQAICGATPYANLKYLATGDPLHAFHDSPQNMVEKPDYDPRMQRGVGIQDYMAEKFFNRHKGGRRGKKRGKRSEPSAAESEGVEVQ
mmetsp:Transcript_31767/g.53582  ORF Transcript_31767/g.53582 Transcript_31767/m.53582 type:complete len:203 (+) Transcript_31767:102-710(+)